MSEFGKWRDTVVEQVRFWPDQTRISRELTDHYEDHVAGLVRLGYDKELAESRALAAMGDAEEVGRALDKVHKPLLGWLWVATTCMVVALVLIIIGNAWMFQGLVPLKNQMDFTLEQVDYESDGKPFHDETGEGYRRLYWESLSESVERSGHTIELNYMGLWKYQDDNGNHAYWLNLMIMAKDPYFWERGPALGLLVIEDSNDCLYRAKYDSSEEIRSYWMVRKQNLFRTIYEVSVPLGDQPVEWVEATYPYGTPWIFRMDLGEVEWQ